jgi:cohesin complex subunit SA-1/2
VPAIRSQCASPRAESGDESVSSGEEDRGDASEEEPQSVAPARRKSNSSISSIRTISSRRSSAADSEVSIREDEDAGDDDEEEEEEEHGVLFGERSPRLLRSHRLSVRLPARWLGCMPTARARGAAQLARLHAHRPRAQRRLTRARLAVTEALHGNEMPNAVNEWLSRYNEDSQQGILELINLILEVADCAGKMSELPEGEEEIGEVVDDLKEHFEDAGPDYLVNTTTKAKKKQRQNFEDLWNKILVQGSNAVIGGDLFPAMIEWLVKLASSEARSLRHTASIVALNWLEACIDVANAAKKELGVAQRQLLAEKKKKKPNAGKVQQLEARSDQLSENTVLLESSMKDVFSGIFVHRYRDVSEKIRVLCLEKMGRFIIDYPSVFLADSYLKYLGWQLYDKSSDVRAACIAAVAPLYENAEHAPNLDLFTTRFKDRMLELQLDIDPVVSALGMQLSTALLQNEILEESEIGDTLAGLKHADPKIRKATAAFVRTYMDMYMESSQVDESDQTVHQLKVLLTICDSDQEDDRSYIWVADSMWDATTVLRDWDAIISLLLQDDNDLDEAANRRLVGLMTCSIKKACGVGITAGTGPTKLSKKQKDAIPDNRQELTASFMLALPKLMERYQADEAVMCDLVEIPAHMDVSQYAVTRKKKALTDLLKHLRVAYMKHSDRELLLHVAGAFRTLTAADFALSKDCKSALDKLRDALIAELGRQVDAVLSGEADDQEAAEYSLEVTLRRLDALYEKVDARSPEALQAVKECLKQGTDDEEELSDAVCCLALSTMHKHCAWDIFGIMGTESREEEHEAVSSRRDAVIEQLLSLESGSPVVRAEAFKVLMDTLVVFSNVPEMEFSASSDVTTKVLAWFEREMQSEGFDSAHELLYVKAITHAMLGGGVSHDEVAPAVVGHFVKHNKECESLIKLFMQSLKKKLPKQGVWAIELGAMTQLFTTYAEKDEQEIYSDLQALVEKVGQAYPQIMRDRTALFNIIKGGISYALEDAPNKILFLDVAILTLSSKFSAPQKSKILEYLEKKMREKDLVADADNEDWNAYFDLEKELQGSSSSRSRKGNAKKAGAGSRRAMQMSLDDDDDDDDDISLHDGEDDNDDINGLDEEQKDVDDDMDSEGEAASRGSSSSRSSKRGADDLDGEDDADDADGDEDSDAENGSNSSGFKPKLRAQTTNSAGKGVPGRGSGFAARKRRRR